MIKKLTLLSLVTTLFTTLAFTGCGGESTSTAEYRELGKAFELDTEPADPIEFTEAKAKAESGDKVVLLGKVGVKGFDEWGEENEPWGSDKATVFITDVAGVDLDHQDDPNHDVDDCPFCKKEKKPIKEAVAMIQFADEEGKVIESDLRNLFEINEGDIVSVTGKPRINPLGFLVVDVDGIYIKQ